MLHTEILFEEFSSLQLGYDRYNVWKWGDRNNQEARMRQSCTYAQTFINLSFCLNNREVFYPRRLRLAFFFFSVTRLKVAEDSCML